MGTVFELPVNDLYSLVCVLWPDRVEEFSVHNVSLLRTRITEWLLINGYSTLHRFSKTDDQFIIAQGTSKCDSCRRKKEEYKYVPKARPSSSRSQTIVKGETFVTLNLRESKMSLARISRVSEQASAYYYSSVTECLSACLQCLLRPFCCCCSSPTK